MERGQEERWVRRAGGKTAGKDKKEKENAFNLFTITVLCWVLAECRVFLSFSRTCLCTQRSEGCWLTANSNCPEAKAATFKQGHSSSHGKGNGLWPWSLITPPPPCRSVQGHQGSPVTNTLTYICRHGDRIEIEGAVTWWVTGRGAHVR